MIHAGNKLVVPKGISKVRVGARLVFDAAQVGGGLSVIAFPEFVRGAQAFGSPVDVTTQATTATGSGGTEPYTYLWSEVTSDGAWTITAPSSRTTSFRATSLAENDTRSGTFKCTVTDARGRTGEFEVDAFCQNYGNLRPQDEIPA